MTSLFNFDLQSEDGWEMLHRYNGFDTNISQAPQAVNRNIKNMSNIRIINFILCGAEYQFNKEEKVELLFIKHAESIRISKRIHSELYSKDNIYFESLLR